MKLNLQIKTNININQVIRLVLAVVIVLEFLVVYFSLVQNLNPQTQATLPNKIVTVDPQAYQDAADLLDQRANFQPSTLNLLNQNPFKYSQ